MKQQNITVTGVITDDLSNCKYKVTLENGKEVKAYLAGKLRKNNIRVLIGDTVTLELNSYDLNNGRIIYRKKVIQPTNED